MATVEEKQEVLEIRDILAKSRPLYKEFAAVAAGVISLAEKLKFFDTQLTVLLNAQETYERRNRDAEARLAVTEKEAKQRLMSIEQSNRTLTDRLMQKEAEMDRLKAEMEKQQRRAEEIRHESEVARDHYEQKLRGLSEVAAPVAATRAGKK